jgi:hypothetical protein
MTRKFILTGDGICCGFFLEFFKIMYEPHYISSDEKWNRKCVGGKRARYQATKQLVRSVREVAIYTNIHVRYKVLISVKPQCKASFSMPHKLPYAVYRNCLKLVFMQLAAYLFFVFQHSSLSQLNYDAMI